MSINGERYWGSVTSNQWCMANIAESIACCDWQGQMAAMSYAEYYREYSLYMPGYFKDRMENLSKIDFSQVKYLVIEHGTNDYNSGRKLDNPDDRYDTTTFGGALRYSLKLLQEAYPDMKIILVTPLYCEFGEKLDRTCYETDFGGGILEEYVRLEQQIAAEYGVICINAYQDSGIGAENAKVYLSDGLHLNEQGELLMGEYLAKELKKVCK